MPPPAILDAAAILSISTAVVALTQLVKWSGLPDHYGPIVVLALSALGVGVWAYSESEFSRALIFDLFTGWIVVAIAAAGVYGFTRAAAESVVRALPPPGDGAGSSATGPTAAITERRASVSKGKP